MAGKTTKKSSRKKTQSKKKQTAFQDEITVLVVATVAVLFFISILGFGGRVGTVFGGFLFGVFGLCAYIFPIMLLLGTLFAVSNRQEAIAVVKIVSGIVFFIFLCLFLQLAGGNYTDGIHLKEIYLYSSQTHMGGGILGGLFEGLFRPNFGLLGAYVIDIAVLIICLVLITERSFLGGLKRGSHAVYSSAKEDMGKARETYERNREEHEREREERKKEQSENEAARPKRIEKRVRGVSMDTEIAPETDEFQGSDEMKELYVQENIKEQTVPENEYFSNTVVEQIGGSQPYFEPADAYKMNVETESTPSDVMPFYEDECPEDVESLEGEVETLEEATLPVKHPKLSAKESEQEVEQFEEEAKLHSKPAKNKYIKPSLSLLKKGVANKNSANADREIRENLHKLDATLKSFGVNVDVIGYEKGPAVTRYELQPKAGVKVSKIVNLSDDIKLNLAASDIRIEAPIPGKSAIGIEVPNKENVTIMLRDLLESNEYQNADSKIAFAVGKDIGGKVIIADIAKMPHLLIAGATGSGKSVCINTIIMSILYKYSPDDVKLIMIDPKVVELSVYNGIPHLLSPVVTDPKKAAGALNWAVQEMTVRYQKFADSNVRDLSGYNQKIRDMGEVEGKPELLPQIVIIVDELADLMMVAPGDVEDSICRLAQLARAAGLHLIIATQRPSVNVITGLIKANMPSRIAFSVSSGVDSRTILDMNGAEKLLGKGDMLFYPQGYNKPKRVQGAFVTDGEVAKVVDFLKGHYDDVSYNDEVTEAINKPQSSDSSVMADSDNDRDELFAQAGMFLIETGKGSIGSLQRKFRIGFNRAARIVDQLEEAGVLGPEEGTKPRQILMGAEQFEQYISEYV